jgi:uncharacterized protein
MGSRISTHAEESQEMEANPAMNSSSERGIDPKLLELLVCPVTKTTLDYDAVNNELISRTAKLAYPIRDGIPIMLPEEARRIEG